MQSSQSITIQKGIHRGQTIIWFHFSNRRDWLSQLKTLKEVKYSQTHGRWYIPYDITAYNRFLQLDIPFVLSGTHADGLAPAQGEPAPSHDHSSISHESVRESESPSSGLEVSDIHDRVNISWTGKGFVIAIPYDVYYIEKVKSLERAYWNAKAKKWMAKNSIVNLERLQKFFHPWSEEEYKKWHDKVMLSHFPCKIQLYRSPMYKDQVCVKVLGYGANHHIVKRISNREYLQEQQLYLIPAVKSQIDQVLEGYADIGYTIENRLDTYMDKSAFVTTTKAKKVEIFLNKLPSNKYSALKKYSDVMLAQNYSFNSIRDYTSKISALMEWRKVVKMEDVSVDDVNRYLQYLVNDNKSYSALNLVHSAVKLYANKVSHVDWGDINMLERPRTPRRLPTFLSEGEMIRLIDSIDNAKHLAIACTLYGSGIRRGEIIKIKVSDIYWDRNQILIRSGKGDKDRMVTLSEGCKEILSIYFHEYKPAIYLIEGLTMGKPYSESSIASMLHRARSRANISKRVTPHVLRHSYATHQMDIGIAIPKIQKLLGHKDIKTTMIYTHLTNEDLQKVSSPLDRVLKKSCKADRK